jgi:hypothetical protein
MILGKSKLLIHEPPLQVLPSLANLIGLNEAIVLQQVHFWHENDKTGLLHDGYKWSYNTYEQWRDSNFPFWSVSTIQRIFLTLEEKGLIVTSQINKTNYDRTKYYRIDYDKLESLITPTCNDRTHQVDVIVDTKLTHSTYTETTSENTTENTSAFSKNKGDILDGILHYGNMAEDKKRLLNYVNAYPEHLRPIAQKWYELFGRGHRDDRERKSWISEFTFWYNNGHLPRLEGVFEKMVKNGLSIKSPLSVTGMLDASRLNTKQDDWGEI